MIYQRERNRIPGTGRSHERRALRTVLKYGGIALGGIILVSACAILFFPGVLINTFAKPRVISAFSASYPAYELRLGEMQYSVLKNRLGCDLITVNARDATFESRMEAASIAGIDWIGLLLGGDTTTDVFADAIIDAGRTVFTFSTSKQELHLGMLHLSLPDSELVLKSVMYDQLLTEAQYFQASKYRQTRFRFEAPLLQLQGIDYFAALHGKGYRARSLSIYDAFADILVNMDKPYDKNSSLPLMPNEALASIKDFIVVDSLNIVDSRFDYREQFTSGGAPGVITFTEVNACVRSIRNHAVPPDTVIVDAVGKFMHAGIMKMRMEIPLSENDFSMSYSGSLTGMNVRALNAFLEAGEHRRITSGTLHSASFHVTVRSGRAVGSVRLNYEHLRVSILDEYTGSAKGLLNRLYSFIGKVFVIRGTNMPDTDGDMKIGAIRYNKKLDDYFFQFIWFSLRGGIGAVVGF